MSRQLPRNSNSNPLMRVVKLPALISRLACAGFLLMSVQQAACATTRQPCAGPGHGKIVVHGGGGEAGTYTSTGLNLCAGPDTRVVLIEHASDFATSSPEIQKAILEPWMRAGARDVAVIDLMDDARAVKAIEQADYLFFDGGDQFLLVGWFKDHPRVLNAIRSRAQEGALVGGMSAGAAAMSSKMIRGLDTASLTALYSGGTLIVPGFGFWPEVIVDQHFLKDRRWARLISAVLDNPAFPGVAIDEETAVIVDRERGTFEVVGNGSVVFIDAREGSFGATKRDETWSASNIRMTILRAGDRFNWRTGIKLN